TGRLRQYDNRALGCGAQFFLAVLHNKQIAARDGLRAPHIDYVSFCHEYLSDDWTQEIDLEFRCDHRNAVGNASSKGKRGVGSIAEYAAMHRAQMLHQVAVNGDTKLTLAICRRLRGLGFQ